MHHPHSSRTAFTLVELSIAIAVIGLLIGGVFVGTSVLRNSELQTVITDYTKYASAANEFKLKYGNPPGDLGDATSYWGDDATRCSDAAITNGAPGTCNGNGNGVITIGTTEPFLAWQHLSLAKLIAGSFTGTGDTTLGSGIPGSRLSGAGWMFFNNTTVLGDSYWYNQDLGNLLAIGQLTTIATPPLVSITAAPIFTATEAKRLDGKLDDGLPATGRTVALKPNASGPMPSCTTTAVDVNAVYNLVNTTKVCGLFISLDLK